MALTIVAPIPRACKVCGCGLPRKSGRGRPRLVCDNCRRRFGGHYPKSKPCVVCQSSIPSGAHRRKYCSDRCAEVGLNDYQKAFLAAKRKPSRCRIKHCAICLNVFSSTHAQRKLCDGCRKTHDGVYQARNCTHCGSMFRPKRHDRKTFCTRACAYAAANRQSSDRQKTLAKAKETAKLARQNRRIEKLLTPCIAHCKVCAEPFDRKVRRYKHTCSDVCQSLSFVSGRKASRRRTRKKLGGSKHRHRAKYYGVPYEPVNVQAVFERDRWRCMICGVKTPPKFRGTQHDRAPELDHRTPMVMGGGHLYDNVQCACRKCNSIKGGKMTSGQLPLFINGL